MSTINFFTPVYYKHEPESLITKIEALLDCYFYLGGKKAVHLFEDCIEVEFGSAPYNYSVLKIASYCTLVMPLLALAAKAICRSNHQFKQLSEIKISIETLTNQEAKKLHQNEDFSTLKKLIKQLYPKLAKENGSSWFTDHLAAGIFEKLKTSPKLLSKLDIEISPKDMQTLFDLFGVVALRPLKHDKLYVFCGNFPLYSSAMRFDYSDCREGAHLHSGKDTCDADIFMNPSVVGGWLTPGLCGYLRAYQSYDQVKGENMSVVSSLKGIIDEEKLSDIWNLLKIGGTTNFDILPSNWEKQKGTIDAISKKHCYTASLESKKEKLFSEKPGEMYKKVVLKKLQ